MKNIFSALLMILAIGLSGANLLPDPEFDSSIASARSDMLPGNFKLSLITEDRTWNKACRIEYLKPTRKAGAPDKCFLTILWSAEKDGGVKPKMMPKNASGIRSMSSITEENQFAAANIIKLR